MWNLKSVINEVNIYILYIFIFICVWVKKVKRCCNFFISELYLFRFKDNICFLKLKVNKI